MLREYLVLAASTLVIASAIAQTPASAPSQSSRTANASGTLQPSSVQAPQRMPSPVVDFDIVNEIKDRTAPMTVDEIRRLRIELAERERAWHENVSKLPPPKPVVSEYRLDLSPGATPPVVRVSMGQGALVTFIGADGKPWPLKEVDNFNATGIRVTQLSGHVLSVSLKAPYATGSVGVILDELATGVTFGVVPAQHETDHRVEMIVPKIFGAAAGGSSSVAGSYSIPSLNTQDLSKYLLKIPPASARELKVEGGDGQVTAWQSAKDRIVVRTGRAVVSPAAYRRHSSADGTYVYELPATPVLTVQGPRASYETVVINGIQVYGVGQAKGGKNE